MTHAATFFWLPNTLASADCFILHHGLLPFLQLMEYFDVRVPVAILL